MGLLLGTRRALLGGAGIRWLLRDEFTDTRAAGAVDGTPATPGPGTRVVVADSGNFLSITGGQVALMQTVGASDPLIIENVAGAGFARAAGRIFLQTVITGAITDTAMVGVSNTAAASRNSFIGFYLVSGAAWNAIVTHAGITGVVVGTWTADTLYQIALVARTTGWYYFLKGGTEFTNWTLVWVDSALVDATLWPGYSAISADAAYALSLDRFRIPDALWLTTPLAYDTFTRANGALGSSEAVGPDGQSTPARAWLNRIGTTLVATNKASASALVGGIAIATVDTGTANAITTATLTRAGNEVGVVLRYADADNYIRAIHDGTNCKLVKRVATVETDVISAVVALGAGVIRVIPDGTSFALYLNDAQVGVTSTISDAALQTGTEQGLFSTNVGNTCDNLSIFARGTNGEYSRLDKWSS